MPKAASTTLTFNNNLQARYPDRVFTRAVRLPGGVSYSAGQVLAEVNVTKQNEVQTLTFASGAGTVYLTVDGVNSGTFAYNASAATIQALMDTLIGSGNVVVAGTGGTNGTYTFTFAGDYSYRDVALMTVSTPTGGGTATMSETTKGSAGITGCTTAWSSTGTNGANIAKGVLLVDAQTNAKGELIDQWGHKLSAVTVPMAYLGEFLISKLTGVNSLNVSQLGKIVDGGLNTSSPSGVDDVQLLAVDTIMSGGSISITATDYTGVNKTAKVAWDTNWTTTVAAIQTALNGLLGTSAVACAVVSTKNMSITFSGTNYTATSQPDVRVDISAATGPTTATITHSTLGYNSAFLSGSVLQLGV